MPLSKKYYIDEIDPNLIEINPRNIRAENEAEIVGDEDFQRLKDSIGDVGVLVPLVVKKSEQNDKQFILIDGERRLRAALATNQEKVPVHIVTEREIDDEVLYAFQIHTLRKEWPRTAQARALVQIIRNVKKKPKQYEGKKLFEIIQDKTGYSENTLKDLFRVIKYVQHDEKILDEIDNPDSKLRFSHLVQLEASFVEQLKRGFPEIIEHYGIDVIRTKLLEKVRNEIIGSTREPIEKLLPLFKQAKSVEQKEYLKKLTIDFLDNQNKTPEDVYRDFELQFPLGEEDLLKLAEKAAKKMEELESILGGLRITQLRVYKTASRKLSKRIYSLMNSLKNIRKQIK